MDALCSREESVEAGISLMETIRAFANETGGSILFGVAADGNVQSINRSRPFAGIARQLYAKCSLAASECQFIESMIKLME